MEEKNKLSLKDKIISLIKNVTKDNLEQIVQAFGKSQLVINDCKEILKLAFKEKGAGLIRSLYKETEKNFKNVLDSNFKKELFELAFNNTSKNPDRSFIVVAEELIPDKQDQIDINELFKKYRERGIKLIELAIINNNDTGLINFLKNKLRNKKLFSELKKEATINLIRNVTKDNLGQIVQAFIESDLEINDRKEILRLAFKEKGAGLIRRLYKETEKNFKNVLDPSFKKELVELAFNNTSKNPDISFIVVAKELIPDKQNQIDINELFKKYRERGIKLIELAIINNNDTGLMNFLKEKLGIDNILDKIIEYSDDVDLFNKFFGINTENKQGEDFLKYANSTILKIYNIGNKEKMIDSILKNCKYPINIPTYNNSLISFLNESLLKNIKIDILSLNKITEKIMNKKELIKINKFENIYENIRKKQNNKIQSSKNTQNEIIKIQGENQTEITERHINYNKDNYLIESIKDTIYTNLKNENENRKLYEVIYKNNGVQEITYYKKDEKTILAIIEIDKNGELKFKSEKKEKKATYNSDEIERILNDDYKSIDAFDHKLSYLSYALLQNEENVVFKTNCKNIEDITNIIKNNENKEELVICDLTIDEHNVQIVINNENITLLNTGYDFEYIKNKIKTSYREQFSKDIKIKQVRTINQSSGNCVIASKLYTVVLSEKYKQNFKNLKNLSERLNKFEEFMEDTLNKTKKEQKDNFNNFKETENFGMLKVILETNVELFNKHEKHFNKMDEKLKNFYKVIKKIDKASNNEEDKILDSKMEEIYKMTNVIGLGYEINKICEEKKINNEYKDIIEYIINNTKEIQTDNNINKIEALKKNKILLKIIYINLIYKDIETKNKNIENINKILKGDKKTAEVIFNECIEKISNLTEKDFGLKKK